MAQTQTKATTDTTYNLISVIYHALQGAETYHTYVRDAESMGNTELVNFFRQAQEQNQRLADEARELLRKEIGRGGGGR